jgi:WD40 repeat protein
MQRPRAAGSIPSNAYVLSIAALSDCYAAAASSPADTIHLYAKADLRHLTALKGHPGGTTSMRSVTLHATSNASGSTLTSCGKDGCIRIWDLRSNSPSLESAFPKHASTRRFPFFFPSPFSHSLLFTFFAVDQLKLSAIDQCVRPMTSDCSVSMSLWMATQSQLEPF